MHVRPILPSDQQDLIALINVICAEGMMATTQFEPTPAWERALSAKPTPGYLLLVAEYGDALIGWCRLFPTGYHTEVELGIGVSQPYRRRGIASMLLQEAFVWAKEHGVIIILQTHKNNLAAQKLFRKHGFISTSLVGNIVAMKWSQV